MVAVLRAPTPCEREVRKNVVAWIHHIREIRSSCCLDAPESTKSESQRSSDLVSPCTKLTQVAGTQAVVQLAIY